MSEPTNRTSQRRGLSRRRLLAGGVVAAPTLALLHETVPAPGPARRARRRQRRAPATGGAPGRPRRPTPAHDAPRHGARRLRPRRRDRRPRAQTASTRPRSCATSTTGHDQRLASGRVLREWELVAVDKEIEVAPGVSSRPGPTTAASPGRPCAARGRAAADPLRQRLRAPAHDPLPRRSTRRSWTGCPDRRARRRLDRARQVDFVYEFDAEPFGLHLYHCHVAPLAEHIARGLYGAFIVDPKQGRPEADELVMVHERLQHQLRRRGQRGLRRQHGRFHYVARPDPGAARRAGPDLPRQHPRVRPDQLVPHPRQLLPLLPDRDLAGADRVHRHDHPGPGPARDPASCASRTPGRSCSTPTRPSSPSSAGSASSRSADWMEARGRDGRAAVGRSGRAPGVGARRWCRWR